MSATEEQQQSIAGDASVPIQISIADLIVVLRQRRRFLAALCGLGMFLATGIALLIPNKYTSTAQLMPPDSQALSGTSMLGALAGVNSIVPSLGAGLMSARTPAGPFIGIMFSRTAQDDIINRFDLRRVYHCKLYFNTRKVLTDRTVIDEDKKSGIISISVTDHDPNRARDLAEAYIEELGKLVNKGSTSSARRERIFLEERLRSIKSDLDTSSRELSLFSSRNATVDPQKQGEATVEAAGRLQGQLIAAQSELSGLKAQYTDDNMRVQEVRGRVDELQQQLRKMSGVGNDVNVANLKSDQLLPSVRQLPLLGFTYYELYRQVTMQETMYELLTKQYELAKVEEAKEIPPVKVLDQPDVPERESSPHRGIIVIVGLLLSAFAGITWILASALWALTKAHRFPHEGGISSPRSTRNQGATVPN